MNVETVDTATRELPGAEHRLPLGAVVIYNAPGSEADPLDAGDRARLIIVHHSRDCDGEPLYMAAKRPIALPPVEYTLYSYEYLAYRLKVGWFVGNCGIDLFEDTGLRCEVFPFAMERSYRDMEREIGRLQSVLSAAEDTDETGAPNV